MEQEKKQYINSVNLNINTDFPYLMLEVVDDKAYPRNPGFQVMHWHDDLQFILVQSGKIAVQTLSDSAEATVGEGFFINKDVIHYVKRLGRCSYYSFLFPSYFLEFYAGSPVREMVESVTENAQISLLHFDKTVKWQEEILNHLQQLAQVGKEKGAFYPYEVLVQLSCIWLILQKNLLLPQKRTQSEKTLRIQKMLRYLEEHYGEEISLEDLAKSANISKSECSRCFKTSLNTTPYRYLTEIRLSKAAQFLKETEQPVGEIAQAVGFHQASHFGKCFKEKTGYTPAEYRKRKRK